MTSAQLQLFPLPIYQQSHFDHDARVWYEATGTKLQLDGFMSAMCGKPVVDVLHVDKQLARRYPTYRAERGLSMDSFVTRQFGDDILYLLNKWI